VKRYTVTYETDLPDTVDAVALIRHAHEEAGDNVLVIVSAPLELNPNYVAATGVCDECGLPGRCAGPGTCHCHGCGPI